MLLRTQKERYIPYAAAMVFYFWAWYVFRGLPDIPVPVKDFLFGSFLAVCAGWMLNIFVKVSMHAIGLGAAVMYIGLVTFTGDQSSGLWLAISLLIAGIVSTSRMIVSNHHPFEIYLGLIAGALCQVAAWVI